MAAVAVALAACTDAEGPSPAATSAEPSREAQARAIFDQIEPSDPFCSAAVLDGDEIAFAEAFGSAPDGPATVETEVDIASVSKQFTGVAIELLIDRGELAGEDLVGELVPASSPATDDVTVDELLTHTSGLPDYGDLLEAESDEASTQAEAIDAIAASSPTDARGIHEYSNSNYVLLAEVVESVDGRPLPEFLADEVFEPLDLAMELAPRGPWLQIGDGSIWTTPTELVTWSTQYWDQTLDAPDLVSVMFDPEVEELDEGDPTGARYGSGISRLLTDDGAELLLHDGSWDGYETDWVLLPDERLAAAVTCNEDAELDDDAPAEALLDLWRR
jgi:CubicO group peptidase (beta-lactamase class C family)